MGKVKHIKHRVREKLHLPKTRKFDGKTYYLSKAVMNRPEARKYAEEAREAGQQARVAFTLRAKWCVYIKD